MNIEKKASLALIREKTLINFNADWKPHLDFLHEIEKNEIIMYGCDY